MFFSKNKQVAEIRNKYLAAMSVLGADTTVYPFRIRMGDYGEKWLDVKHDGVYLVQTERGREIRREQYKSNDEYLFQLLMPVVSEMAADKVGVVPDTEYAELIRDFQKAMIEKVLPGWAHRVDDYYT